MKIPRLMPAALLLVALFAAAAAPAAAPNAGLWAADPAKSTLEFNFVQAGARTTGRLTKFVASIDFDPASPATGKIDVAIDMSSADTRDKERDDTLKTKDLFDATAFLRSTYVATQIVAKGSGWEGRGKLPGYRDWLFNSADLTSTYQYHKRFLQLLQAEAPGIWTLKQP